MDRFTKQLLLVRQERPGMDATPGFLAVDPLAFESNSTRELCQANPVFFHYELLAREWRLPGLNVDCNRTNSARVQASVQLDSNFNEKVVGVTARVEGTDKIKDITGPTVESPPGPTVVVSYGFNGLDKNAFGNCAGGGHATLVVVFNVQRKVPVSAP